MLGHGPETVRFGEITLSQSAPVEVPEALARQILRPGHIEHYGVHKVAPPDQSEEQSDG